MPAGPRDVGDGAPFSHAVSGSTCRSMRGLIEVDLDQPALAGLGPREQRGENAHGVERGGVLIDDDRTDGRRLAVGAPGSHRKTRHRLEQQVLPRAILVRPVRSESGRDGIDQARVDGLQRLVTEPQLGHGARPEILHHDIGRRDQLLHGSDAVGMLEINGEAALVAPGRQMIDAIARDEMIGDRPVALKRALDRLDRDDIGAEIGERLRGQRAREVMIEAEDLDAVEQVHSFTPN